MQIQTSRSTLNLGLTAEKLLEELEDLYPPFNPQPDMPINQLMYRAGQRSVVELIRNRIFEEE